MYMYLRPVPADLGARVERDAEPRRPRRAAERGGRVAAEHAAAEDRREDARAAELALRLQLRHAAEATAPHQHRGVAFHLR